MKSIKKAGNGLISDDDFQEAVDRFIKASSVLHDTWQRETLIQGNVKVTYLKRRTGKWMQVSSHQKRTNVEPDSDLNDEFLNDCGSKTQDMIDETLDMIDNDMVSPEVCKDAVSSLTEKVYCHVEHSIVYSQSYSVPVMYFNIFLPGGELLTLEDLWENSVSKVPYKVDNLWAFITQQEHPLLQRPFFQLHPCHTEELMKEITGRSAASPGVYLLSWLSSIAPLVHLDLSLQYANEILRGQKMSSSGE